MTSPAQRYAAFRQSADTPHLRSFSEGFDFPLDPFQEQACAYVEAGQGVLVAAPTGAGKTVVGEFAVFLALATGRKAFYTTPIKALSNQKYRDLVARYGAETVGLLTGDSSINGEAPIVVMTTEVLRNMMYSGSRTLEGLGFVVMDEVHYLADRFRGPVWEEVIINLPESVQVVSLSATVSNAEEFGDWLNAVRGNYAVVVSEHRPVPLWQHMLVGHTMYDLFADQEGMNVLGRGSDQADPTGDRGSTRRDVAARVNPELLEAIRNLTRTGAAIDQTPVRGRDHARNRGRGGRFGGGASRTDVIRELDRDGLLPAITFIFSRVGCEAAVGQLLSNDLRLIPHAEGERIRRLVEERVGSLTGEDLGVLGYWDFVEGLTRGFAAHHAGMLPLFRELVEELFSAGRIRAVFATETLALGINMPARSVVLEKLVKFNGENHVDVTPAEYTQLTGRAGRRGIDIEGHAVVQWHRGLDPLAVAGLASTRTYPLRSSFAPTYNMAVNLVATVGRDTAREILETSFAQFQADRAVVGLATKVRRNEEALEGYAEAMTCHLGDFTQYAALRREIADAEKDGAKARSASRRAEAAISLDALRIGDVFRIPSGRDSGWAVVIQPSRTHRGEWTGPSVVTEDRHFRRLNLNDVPAPVERVATVKVSSHFNPKNPKSRRDIATSLRIAVPHDDVYRDPKKEGKAAARPVNDRVDDLRRALKAHPCHQCPDREDHARWSERWWRLKRETIALQRKVDGRTSSIAATFDRICQTLTALGYLDESGEGITVEGERLRRLYTERDLLAAECLRAGVWKRLDGPGLAAVVSSLVHEPRGEVDLHARMPSDDVAEALTTMTRLWSQLEDREHEAGLQSPPAPDGGIAWAVYQWAKGQRLDVVLRDQDLAAGDFVRRCKMIVDLLGQIAQASTDDKVRKSARSAIDQVMRGVVAADRLD